MPPIVDFPAVRIMQACAICSRPLPLEEETFDFCPRCGRLVCKEKCARTCPFCQVSRCVLCLEEIHGNTRSASCEKCMPAFDAAMQIK